MDHFHLPHLRKVFATILVFPVLFPAVPLSAQVGEVRGELRSSYNHERYEGVPLILDQQGTPLMIDGVTGAEGVFVFSNVPVGNYTLTATKAGFTPVDSALVVTPGGTIEVIVELTPPWVADLPPVKPGTVLDSIRDVYSQKGVVPLPPADHEDRSSLPVWYRRWVRSSNPGLLEQGPQQYPIEERELLRWTLGHQDLQSYGPAVFAVSVPTPDGKNVNLTNQKAEDRETSVAVDPYNPMFVVAASNSITTSPWSLKTFRSSDGGCSWNSIALPKRDDALLSYDPAVAWHPGGSAWVSSIVRLKAGGVFTAEVQVHRSTTRGASWEYVATVSEGAGNDKEMMAIDPGPVGTGYGGRIYVAWTHAGASTGIRFRWSDDDGAHWSSPIAELSTVEGMAPHIAVGPGGEVYVAWREGTGGIKVATSSDGGVSFGTAVKVADANGANFRFKIPAACVADFLSYPVLAVDRNPSSPLYGSVHLAWTDLNSLGVYPECSGGPGHLDVYFSTYDPHGTSWSTPVRVHDSAAEADQFNPWMDVDPTDTSGRVHLIYYGSGATTFLTNDRAVVRLLYLSRDPTTGNWTAPIEVATEPSDDTNHPDPVEYGHYSAVAAFNNLLIPVWTDGRPGLPGERNQVFSATIRDGTLMNSSCPLSQVAFIPSQKVRLKKDTSVDVEVQVSRKSAPLAGEWVSLDTIRGSAISFDPITVQTDASGRAKIRVRGEKRGSATLGAEAAGVSGFLKFRVRGVWGWWVWAIVIVVGILIAALVIWLVWRNTKPWSGKAWAIAILLGVVFAGLFTFLIWFYFE